MQPKDKTGGGNGRSSGDSGGDDGSQTRSKLVVTNAAAAAAGGHSITHGGARSNGLTPALSTASLALPMVHASKL